MGLTIALIGLTLGANTVWSVATLPAKLRNTNARGETVSVPAVLFQVVMSCFGFFICLALTSLVLLATEGMLTRKGSFSGAGAASSGPCCTSSGHLRSSISAMPTNLTTIEDALAGLTDAELHALIAASNRAPPIAYGLLVWI